MNRPAVLALAAVLSLVLSSCGAAEQEGGDAVTGGTPTPTLSSSPSSDTTAGSSPSPSSPAPEENGPRVRTVELDEAISHVHGLVVDEEGVVRAGTHEGVRVIDDQGGVTAVGPQDDLMGMTGLPGTRRLVSSGHPGPGRPLPNPLGLLRSDDGGETWDPVSLTGEIDFHALAVTDDYLVGFDGVTGLIVSTDGGSTWDQGPRMAAASLAAVGDEVWAATPDGLMHSTDRAASFAPVDGAPLLRQVSAGVDGSLWGVDVDGTAWVSADGRQWTEHEEIASAQAIAALDRSTAYAVDETTLFLLSV
ncbi:F510_1955 family glycosylhydrolase [Isoptericola sp. 178]|uniref:F510_1955 family glycosylhydrolase n=1 Tax=Isoptericola sp. 178 TaxID=3064651 RepID=UPI002713D2EE|nr:hypothetical protein [Isoptericola sp. 178]MDO8143410.1 hypothetical protein [Isoptericola sp. 178]